MTSRRVILMGATLATAAACAPEREAYRIEVHVRDVDGARVADVPIRIGGLSAGLTNPDGLAATTVLAPPDAPITVEADLPAGMKLSRPTRLPLVAYARRALGNQGTAEDPHPVSAELLLEPQQRAYAILVSGAPPGTTVKAQGTVMSRANQFGATMFLYKGEPGGSLQVALEAPGAGGSGGGASGGGGNGGAGGGGWAVGVTECSFLLPRENAAFHCASTLARAVVRERVRRGGGKREVGGIGKL